MRSLILDNITGTIQIVLAGAVTTNQLEVTAHYADITTLGGTPGNQLSTTNSTTDVDIVAAPGASTQRVIAELTIYNADTVSATITIKHDDGGTEHIIYKVVLGVGETWEMSSATSGGGGAASPLTTKGDLYTYSTVDARLAVGTNDYKLIADSTETTGLKWDAPGASNSYNDTTATNITTTNTSFSSLSSNYELAITTTGGDVLVGWSGAFSHSIAGQPAYFDIVVNTTSDGGTYGVQFASEHSADATILVGGTRIISGLSAGSHTIKLQWKVASGTATWYVNTGTAYTDIIPQFWVQEVKA